MASRTDHAGYAVIGDPYAFPVEYEVALLNLDRDGNAESGACFAAGDTKIAPVDLEVVTTALEFPIDACLPAGGR